MRSVTAPNARNPLFLSTPFLHRYCLRPPPPQKLLQKSLSVSALILPPSSSKPKKFQLQPQPQVAQPQKLYQPYKPPPSPLPSRYRSLDTSSRLEILSTRMGFWYEYAPIIPSLYQEGFISTTLEEITGIPSVEQNQLVVATQVRDSLVEAADEETVSFFDPPSSPEILYELRILNTPQRALSAKLIITHGFDGKRAEELARSIKDFSRRYGDRGWEFFDGNLPGDCLAFMYYRQAQEHKTALSLDLSKDMLEKALEIAETDKARQKVIEDLEGRDSDDEGGAGVDDLIRVPVVRMAFGEVAESTSVVVLPVCKEDNVEEAPWECGMVGDFGVVEAEKGWQRWVVLPGWGPVIELRRGGVAVTFSKAREVFPWKVKRKYAEEEVLVVVDRKRKEVEGDDEYYLVNEGKALKVGRGAQLKEKAVQLSLGIIVLVVRPPRDDFDDQIADEDWD